MFDWKDWVSGLSDEDIEDLRKIVEDEIKWRKKGVISKDDKIIKLWEVIRGLNEECIKLGMKGRFEFKGYDKIVVEDVVWFRGVIEGYEDWYNVVGLLERNVEDGGDEDELLVRSLWLMYGKYELNGYVVLNVVEGVFENYGYEFS